RPNCIENEIQSCCAFHIMTGRKMMSAMNPPAQSQGLPSQRRAVGSTDIQATMPMPKKRLVYLETQPRPANSPTRSQSQGRFVRQIAERAQTASVQNIIEGASGVLRITPTPIRIMALNQRVARKAIERGEKSWRAIPKTAIEVTKADRMGSTRMPSAVSPRVRVESQIHHATI